MPDHNEILRKLAEQTAGTQAVDQLRVALSTPAGSKAAKTISAQHARELERAAQAAERGDLTEATRLAQKLMNTPEGAQLAAQFKTIFKM